MPKRQLENWTKTKKITTTFYARIIMQVNKSLLLYQVKHTHKQLNVVSTALITERSYEIDQIYILHVLVLLTEYIKCILLPTYGSTAHIE
jgi:hypothetical protein